MQLQYGATKNNTNYKKIFKNIENSTAIFFKFIICIANSIIISTISFILMSRKFEENTHDTLFDETVTKLLVSNSKSQIHEGFIEFTR